MLTAAQICTLARQIAKCPGFSEQSGQLLNSILTELCQNYDLELAKATVTVTLAGVGPFTLPDDFLRPKFDTLTYQIDGVPYKMVQVDDAQFVDFVQTTGINSYPQWFRINNEVAPKTMEVWPPPSGSFDLVVPYFRQMAAIATPESSNVAPWFINETYLLRRLAGELMTITGDSRANGFLGDHDTLYPQGAGTILRRYLKMKDSDTGFVKQVVRDPRVFRTPWGRLPNTKSVGW